MTRFTFGRAAPPPEQPTISVICLNKNHGTFIEDNIHSVLSQKFDDFEYLIADGGSIDDSLEIIRRYPFITLLPGPDESVVAALMKLYRTAKGRYVMVTTSTDGYLCRDWFRLAASTLDRDQDVSLVWGASAAMSADGTLGAIVFPRTFLSMPQRTEWFGRWINDRNLEASYLPELNYCLRANVLESILNSSDEYEEIRGIDPILRIHFGFNRQGYLPHYLPVLANFGRIHPGQLQHGGANRGWMEQYDRCLRRYWSDLIEGRRTHVFRDGSGRTIGAITAEELRELAELAAARESAPTANRGKGRRTRVIRAMRRLLRGA